MVKPEPFEVPQLKDQVGWRLSEEDKQDLRIVMAQHREKSLSKMLRILVQREAAGVRRHWMANILRRAKGADGG